MNVLWDGDDNASVRSRFARTVDPQGAVKRLESFHDALKAEVPLFDAWTGGRIESATVVRDGKEQMGTFDAAGDLDGRGSPMADCVDRQFADDAEDSPTFLIIGKLEKFSDGNCGLSASFGNIAA